MKQILSVLTLLAFLASCNGQQSAKPTSDGINKQASITTKDQPTIVKPFGVDPYTNIRCSLQDRAGNLWFGTTGAGVYRYDGKSFTNFTAKEGLCSGTVYCMLEDREGNIWVGTNNGVCFYDGKIFSPLPIPGIYGASFNPFYGALAFYNSDYCLPEARSVYSMIQDKRGNFWFGTALLGLYRYDGEFFTNFKYKDSTWRPVPADSMKLKHPERGSAIQCMLQDSNGDIWFSANSGTGVYRYDGQSFTHLKDKKTFGNDNANGIFEDKTGKIWFTTWDNGVVQFDGKSFTSLTGKQGFLGNFITSIIQDKKGVIWLGSSRREMAGREEGYVTRYDGKTFTNFPLNGLANTSIWSILEDKNENIWLGSRNLGLYRFDGKSFTDFSEKKSKPL